MSTQAILDMGNVILEPTSTFTRLKGKPSAWVPLVVLIVLSVAVSYWWISTEDFAWLIDHMMAAKANMKEEERAAMARILTPTTMLWTSAGGAVVGTLVIFAVIALYYSIAGRFIDTTFSYGRWFAFVVWVSVPRLLAVPLSAVQIMTSHGRLAPEDLNMVSLNYLLFHLPASSPWASLVGNIDLTSIWTIALAAIGLKAWTGRPMSTCVTVAVLPYLLVYGLWAAKIAIFG
jgi:hypothetical protein